MKSIILIFILFPLLIYGQGFNQPKQGKDTTHTFILRSIADTFTTKSDTVINRIDSTNKILSKFYFESGVNALLVKVCEPLSVNTDTTINATIREMRDSIARQNIILMNQSTPTLSATTPSYTSNRTLLTANTTPAPYSVGVPVNTREITIQNVTGSDILITTSQGTQILGTRNNITLSNPINTTINHSVFTGNITISFFSSVLGNISGVQPRVIIDFKSY